MKDYQPFEHRAAYLRQLYDDSLHPFPGVDCARLVRNTDIDSLDFYTYLDLYDDDLIGYCSWGSKILEWPVEKLRHVADWTTRGFEGHHPEFARVWANISESRTPDLYKLRVHLERARIYLHDLVADILHFKFGQE